MSQHLPPLHCRVCHEARACDANKDACCKTCEIQCNAAQRCFEGEDFISLASRGYLLGCRDVLTPAERNLHCLITVPAGDVNFKGALERAGRDTIKAALEAIDGQPETKTKEQALRRKLKTFLQEKLDTISGTNQRQDRALALNTGELQAERERQQQEKEEQAEREQMIAQSYEIAGQIKAVRMMSKFGDVTSLMWLKQVKESKIYRDIPGIGTWEKYCEYVGIDRHTTDQNLLNLAAFGEEFMGAVTSLGVGYRELRQLRQLQYDGDSFQVVDDGKTVIIEGETIPLGDDGAAPLIEGALEKLLIKKKALADRNKKLEKEFKAAVKEETASLESEKKALLERVQKLEQYEPKAHDGTWCEEQMKGVKEKSDDLCTAVANFIVDPRLETDRAAQAGVLAHLNLAEMMLADLRERFITAFPLPEGN